MLDYPATTPKKVPAKKAAAKSATKGPLTALAELKSGGTIPGASAPAVGGKPFTVSATVETAQRDTVVVAHGGQIGYAIHLKAGRLVFAVRHSPEQGVEITSTAEMKETFSFSASLGADGAMKLFVDGQEVAMGKSKGLLPRQPAEDFCLGHDNGKPVGVYGPVSPLQGKVTELKIISL